MIAGKLHMIHIMIEEDLEYREDRAYRTANESQQKAVELRDKQKPIKEACHITKAQCTALEVKIDQVCSYFPAVPASVAPVEKLEGLATALKASHDEAKNVWAEFEQQISDLQMKL